MRLRNEFKKFGEGALRPTAISRDVACYFDPHLWKTIAGSGFFNLSVPNSGSGLPVSLSETVEACRGLAAGSLDLPLTVSAMVQAFVATDLLLTFGSPAQIDRYLGRVATGECIAAVANSEASGGTDVMSLGSSIQVSATGAAQFRIRKQCATNLSRADLVFVSAWKVAPTGRPVLDVYLVEPPHSAQVDLSTQMIGFRTGMTGSLEFQTEIVDVEASRLGPYGSGLTIFQRCFDLERLYISAIAVGVLEGLLPEGLDYVRERTSRGKSLGEYQYIQEKIFYLHSVKEILLGMLSKILYGPEAAGSARELSAHSLSLSILKNATNESGLEAANRFFELFGFPSYLNSHIAGKFLRDMTALKFFGGTRELHKIRFFEELTAPRKFA